MEFFWNLPPKKDLQLFELQNSVPQWLYYKRTKHRKKFFLIFGSIRNPFWAMLSEKLEFLGRLFFRNSEIWPNSQIFHEADHLQRCCKGELIRKTHSTADGLLRSPIKGLLDEKLWKMMFFVVVFFCFFRFFPSSTHRRLWKKFRCEQMHKNHNEKKQQGCDLHFNKRIRFFYFFMWDK